MLSLTIKIWIFGTRTIDFSFNRFNTTRLLKKLCLLGFAFSDWCFSFKEGNEKKQNYRWNWCFQIFILSWKWREMKEVVMKMSNIVLCVVEKQSHILSKEIIFLKIVFLRIWHLRSLKLPKLRNFPSHFWYWIRWMHFRKTAKMAVFFVRHLIIFFFRDIVTKTKMLHFSQIIYLYRKF